MGRKDESEGQLAGTGTIVWPFITPETRRVKYIDVPVDVLLSVPMFLRSYLLCRFMVLHSKQFQVPSPRPKISRTQPPAQSRPSTGSPWTSVL